MAFKSNESCAISLRSALPARNSHRWNAIAPFTTFLFVAACASVWLAGGRAKAQSHVEDARVEASSEVQAKLSKRYSLDLRDATLLEALFAIRDVSGLNIVVGNEVTGTVNASFADTTVYDILDSMLITRGYGYRIVGGSLAIVPLTSLGDQLPLFKTEVISLRNNSPEDLVESIESLLSPEGRAHGVASSNSIVVIDYPSRIANVRVHIETLETAAEQFLKMQQDATGASTPVVPGASMDDADIVRVFPTQYVSATILTEAITPLLTESGQASAVDQENKLIVSDTNQAVERIALALLQLDRPRPQVRIRAMIYDCSTEDLERLGINWRSGLNASEMVAATGEAAHSLSINSITAPVSTGTNGVVTLSSLSRHLNMESIIQALNTAGDSRLLADPNVVVMNHETAEIKIVTEVPYQQLTQGLEGGTIGTTEFREAGVTLHVVPHIADDETIAMEVNPRFSLLTGFSEPDNAPIIDRRETTTTVRVVNQQTVVLGGLRQRTRISELSSIPCLGQVPWVGKFFRHRKASTRESELLVFITPELVLNYDATKPREHCVNEVLQGEIREAPTDPVPFGFDILLQQQIERGKSIDHPHMYQKNHGGHHIRHSHPTELIDGNITSTFESEVELIDVGLSEVEAQ